MDARFLFRVSAMNGVLLGIALLVSPLFVVGWILGDGLNPTGIAVARLLGVGLLSVGVAGWESQGQDVRLAPRAGLCIYNVGASTVLVTLGTSGAMTGALLWPAAVLHALIGALMLWILASRRRQVLTV